MNTTSRVADLLGVSTKSGQAQDWGDRSDAGTGASSYAFSKRSWRRFARYLGSEARLFERYRNVYVVVAKDGAVITVCWRH